MTKRSLSPSPELEGEFDESSEFDDVALAAFSSWVRSSASCACCSAIVCACCLILLTALLFTAASSALSLSTSSVDMGVFPWRDDRMGMFIVAGQRRGKAANTALQRVENTDGDSHSDWSVRKKNVKL